MCGIIAYSGRDNAIPYLTEGIKELEYRGYDSFGCAFEDGDGLQILKGVGTVHTVTENVGINRYFANRGVFHTRWATHGGVSETNAHPMADCSGRIAVSHNGIIENWKEIKAQLTRHSFHSDTDSEVIPHLIEDQINSGSGFKEAVEFVGEHLVGSSSFIVIREGSEEMAAYKNGSPLILAIGENGIFVSSDVPSVLRYTRNIVYLHDGDLVVFSGSSYEITNKRRGHLPHRVVTVDLDINQASRGEYAFYMEKEILEQPSLWRAFEKYPTDSLLSAAKIIREGRRVFMIASGSSFYAAAYGAMKLRHFGVDSLALQPQELQSHSPLMSEKDVVIIISQSGETADLISIFPLIENNKKIGIVNVEGSRIATAVNLLLQMKAGPERGVAATKTLTSTLFILTLLCYATRDNFEQGLKQLMAFNKSVYNFTVPSVMDSIEEVADLLYTMNDVYFVGKGSSFVLAQEGALKMKEISYLHAEAIDLATMKHGPLALVSNGTKVVAVVGNEDMKDSLYNLEELRSRGAEIIGIGESESAAFDKFLRIPDLSEYSFAPALMVMQLLAYKVALKKGLDPDRPRNLAKSVTVK